jgi:hypothetical protein
MQIKLSLIPCTIFHERYKNSQTNIRNQVHKNMNKLEIQNDNVGNEREYWIIVPKQGNK